MGAVLVHEFTTLDGVIDAPTWTFDYPFDPPDVDEIHLFVFPLTLGAGQRLFPEGGPRMNFRTADAETYDSGVVHLTLEALAA